MKVIEATFYSNSTRDVQNSENKIFLLQLMNVAQDDKVHKILIDKVVDKYVEDVKDGATNKLTQNRLIILDLFTKHISKKCLKKYLFEKLVKVVDGVISIEYIILDSLREIMQNINDKGTCNIQLCIQILNMISVYMGSFKDQEQYDFLVENVFRFYLIIHGVYVFQFKFNNNMCLPKYDDVNTAMDEILKQELIILTKSKNPKLVNYAVDIIELCYAIIMYDDKIKYEMRAKSGLVLARCLNILPNTELETIKNRSYPILDALNNIESQCSINLKSLQLYNAFQNNDANKIILYYAITNATDNLVDFQLENSSLVEFLCKNLVNCALRATFNPSVIVVISRALSVIADNFHKLPPETFSQIIDDCLEFTWTHVDHFVQCVTHLTKSFFLKVAQYAVIPRKRFHFMNMIIEKIKSMSPFDNVRLICLAIIADLIECEILLESFNNLPDYFLEAMNDLSTVSDAAKIYMTLMEKHIYLEDMDFIALWIEPISKALKYSEGSATEHYENLVMHAFQLKPSIFRKLFPAKYIGDKVDWSIQLRCLHIARLKGIELPMESDEERSLYWRDLIAKQKLELFMVHQDEGVRLLVLKTLIECQRSTEELTKWEIVFLVSYYSYNVTTQKPSTRKAIGTLFKKLFVRYQKSTNTLVRQIKNGSKLLAEIPSEQLAKDIEQMKKKLTFMKLSLEQFSAMLINDLGPDSNYPRRTLALELLLVISEITNFSEWKSYFSDDDINNLKNMVFDSYENNKQMAVNLLRTLYVDSLGFKNHQSTYEYFEQCLSVSSDINPTKTLSASYMLQICLLSPFSITNSDREKRLQMLDVIIDRLESQFNKNQFDVLQAAQTAPLHGLLISINTLINGRNATQDDEYIPIFKRVVAFCLMMKEHIMPVVCNPSPEGHIPDNLSIVIDETSKSQVILVYAWRTMREAMLLLAEIVQQSVDQENNEMLSEEEFIEIGHFFIDVFLESKHRGVFEQAHVAFTKICEAFWRSRNDKINCLPSKWTDDVINICTGDVVDERLCTTRRSAGLPFLILSILTTEIPLGKSCFEKTMNALLKNITNTKENIEIKVHSLNILRAIFKDSKLSDFVPPYAGGAFIPTINGFQSSIWGVRNSSTLLFSALITRMFGVQRSQDSEILVLKNRMAITVFYLRYQPLLRDILYSLAVECNKNNSLILYPILLLLARLYPSHSEETNELLQNHFHHISTCLSNPSYRIRELAARASLSIISNKLLYSHLVTIFCKISNEQIEDRECHGLLLEVWQIINTNKFSNQLQITDYLINSMHLLKNVGTRFSHMTVALYMEIITMLLIKQEDYNDIDPLKTLVSLVSNISSNGIEITWKSKFKWSRLQLLIYIVINKFEHINTTYQCVTKDIMHYLYGRDNRIKKYCLYFLIYMHQKHGSNLKQNESPLILSGDVDIPQNVQNLANSFDYYSRKNLLQFTHPYVKSYLEYEMKQSEIRTGSEYSILIFMLLKYYPCVLKTVSDSPQGCLDYLLKFCDCDSEELITVVIGCVAVLLFKTDQYVLEKMNHRQLIDILAESASPAVAEFRRLSVAQFLVNVSKLFYGKPVLKDDQLCDVLNIAMILLEDDELEIRNTISTFKALDKSMNTGNLFLWDLVPDKARTDLLARAVKLLHHERAICFLVSWSCRHLPEVSIDVSEVYERAELNPFAENVPISYSACKVLNSLVWPLGGGLSYEDKSMNLEEQTLLVTTVVLDALVKYPSPMMLKSTKTSVICALKSLIIFIEGFNIGGDFRTAFKNFFNGNISKYLLTSTKSDYYSVKSLFMKLYNNVLKTK